MSDLREVLGFYYVLVSIIMLLENKNLWCKLIIYQLTPKILSDKKMVLSLKKI